MNLLHSDSEYAQVRGVLAGHLSAAYLRMTIVSGSLWNDLT